MTPLHLRSITIEPRWILGIAAGLALGSVVIAGARSLTRLDALSQPPKPERNRTGVRPSLDLQPALALAPFGNAVDGDENSGELTLKGLVQGAPETATALIAVRDGPARPYGVGDEVGTAARLEAVAVDHALLRTDVGLVRLSFPKAKPGEAGGPAIAAPPSAKPSASEPGAVQADGYRIGAAPWPELQRVGVQSGDVIASVNGLPVGEMERGVVDAIASGKARVEVLRDGRKLILGEGDR